MTMSNRESYSYPSSGMNNDVANDGGTRFGHGRFFWRSEAQRRELPEKLQVMTIGVHGSRWRLQLRPGGTNAVDTLVIGPMVPCQYSRTVL